MSVSCDVDLVIGIVEENAIVIEIGADDDHAENENDHGDEQSDERVIVIVIVIVMVIGAIDVAIWIDHVSENENERVTWFGNDGGGDDARRRTNCHDRDVDGDHARGQ